MKKSSNWITLLLVIAALALCFVAVRFFVLPGINTGNDVKNETKTETTMQPQEEKASPVGTITEAREGTTIIETDSPAAEIIDLTDSSSNDIRIETTGPLEFKTPESANGYTKISMLGLSDPVWAYQGKDGNIHLRTYGVRWKKVNNVNQEQLEGFFMVDIRSSVNGKVVLEKAGAMPIPLSKEDFAEPDPVFDNMRESLDSEKYHQEKDNLFSCITKTGALAYRTFAMVNDTLYLYDCDSEGKIASGSLPVCSEEEVYNLAVYTDGFVPSTSIYSYPVKYNQTSSVFTVETDRSNR